MTTTSSTSGTSAGSSIVTALGSGSGIDTSALISKLVEVNRSVQDERLTTKKTLLETQISDYGLLKSAFSTLNSAFSTLANADTFNAKSASIPTTSLISVTKLEAKASIGEYSMTVTQLAQSQSLSSSVLTSQTTPIGKGSLTIRLGSWNEPPTVFTADSTKTGGTITIDDSNNSLTGLRDAINKSSMGVKASIVAVTGGYKLLVTAPSGESNEIEITATETAGAEGLASFNFNQTTRNLSQLQPGQDATMTINGMSVTKSSNHITDVIEGLEFDLTGKSATETITLGITEDKTGGEKAIRDFVTAYNTFLTDSGKLVGFDKEKNANGSLKQDPLAKNLIQQVRNQLSSVITGLSGKFTSLGNLGIRTELDGTLSIDDSTAATSFKSAVENNFDAIRDFFVPTKTSTSAQISVSKHTNLSTPGSYAVAITAQPARGYLNGGTLVETFPLDASTKSYSFKITVDGVESGTVTLPSKTYASGSAMASELQSLINVDSSLVTGKASVSVSFNSTSNRFEFASTTYGSTSKVVISSPSSDLTADLGISAATGVSGVDVAGTVGGVAAFGLGKVLLPALGSAAEGLNMLVEPGATSATISFSRGFAGNLTSLIDGFLKTQGSIKAREDNITKDITKVKTDQAAVDRRSESYRARLQAQFSAMESIVRGLKSTGTFLTGAFKALQSSSDS